MDDLFVLIPMIGGMAIAFVSVVMDYQQKKQKTFQENRMNQIMTSDDMPLEEIVRSILSIQIAHQQKDKWIERIIGFLMGLASSLAGSLIFYFVNG